MLPPAIIFVNADINNAIQNTLVTQLYIDEAMSFNEFNARVNVDPNYPTVIHLQYSRILVILPTFQDQTNRALADVVLFYNQGQVTVEKNNFGPPGLSLPLQRVNVWELLRAVRSQYVIILPGCESRRCWSCEFPFRCDKCHTFSGIRTCTSCCGDCASTVHLPNCDNEYNNPDFINRK